MILIIPITKTIWESLYDDQIMSDPDKLNALLLYLGDNTLTPEQKEKYYGLSTLYAVYTVVGMFANPTEIEAQEIDLLSRSYTITVPKENDGNIWVALYENVDHYVIISVSIPDTSLQAETATEVINLMAPLTTSFIFGDIP